MKAERGIASLLADSDWSNKIMNMSYVHDIMKAERGIASLLADSDWSIGGYSHLRKFMI